MSQADLAIPPPVATAPRNIIKVAIVGLPKSGKSTFYQSLAAAGAEPTLSGVRISISDPRLSKIAASANLQAKPIQLDVIDAYPSGSDGCDGVLHVCRLFEGVDGQESVDAIRDMERIFGEFIAKDLAKCEALLQQDKLDTTAVEALTKAKAHLSSGKQLRCGHQWSAAECAVLSQYDFLTAKPTVFLANLTAAAYQDEHHTNRQAMERLQAWVAEHTGEPSIVFCAELEAGGTLGSKSQLPTVATAVMNSMKMIAFYTTRSGGIDSFPLLRGDNVAKAAERVQAENPGLARVVHFQDFEAVGDLTKAAATEKKGDYVVQDGDCIQFVGAA